MILEKMFTDYLGTVQPGPPNSDTLSLSFMEVAYVAVYESN